VNGLSKAMGLANCFLNSMSLRISYFERSLAGFYQYLGLAKTNATLAFSLSLVFTNPHPFIMHITVHLNLLL